MAFDFRDSPSRKRRRPLDAPYDRVARKLEIDLEDPLREEGVQSVFPDPLAFDEDFYAADPFPESPKIWY